jgi:replication factor A1
MSSSIQDETKIGKLLNQILSSNKTLTRKEITTAIEEKIAASKHLLTKEAAARLIAAELGVTTIHKNLCLRINIKHLTFGLNDVTTIGRVLAVSKLKTFSRQGGDGQLIRLKIADKTGKVDIVLWNEKTEIVKQIQLGNIIRIRHAYVRRSKNGEREIHIGERGNIQVHPLGINEIEYPAIEKFLIKIKEITKGNKRVNVKGIIQELSPLSIFQRKDGTSGKIARLILEDKSSNIPIVIWNERAEEIDTIREGDEVLIMNVKVKENQRQGKLELHLDNYSNMQIVNN